MMHSVRRWIRIRSVLLCLLGVVTALAAPIAGHATESVYWVAPNGDDAGPGTADRPWRSLGKATATLVPGDTVRIRGGRYAERVRLERSGAPEAMISFVVPPGEKAVLDGTNIEVPEYGGLFEICGVRWIRVSGLEVQDCGETGILVDGSEHIVVEQCRTSRTGCSGIGVWGSREVVVDGNEVALSCRGGMQEAISVGGTTGFDIRRNHVHNGPVEYRKEGICAKDGSSRGRIRGNHVHHTRAVGIYVDAFSKHTFDIEVDGNDVHDVIEADGIALASETGGLLENVRVRNNVSWSNGLVGISITRNGSGTRHPMRELAIVNNTIWDNGRGDWGGGIVVDNPDLVSAVIRNNLCSRNLTFDIAAGSAPRGSLTLDHNLIDGQHEDPDDRPGSDAVRADPRLRDPARGDFRLRSGSPAIDAGSPAGAPPQDHDGNSRPRGAGVDIGAFES